MTDNRPRVQLDGKVINLNQLTQELGGVALCASATEVVAAEGVDITQAQLEAAILAHVPDPDYGKSADDLLLEAFAANPAPSAKDTAAALKVFMKRGRE